MKKNSLPVIFICVLTLFLSCQNEIHQTKKDNLSLIFNSGVGEPISAGIAARWIERYNKQSAASRNGQTYSVTQTHLEAMMRSTSGLVGFTFHHALDNSGEHHILIIPIDNTLRLWTSSSQRVLLDTNIDTEIDLNTARNWIDNYTATNPNSIRYHFFGADIFQQIVQSPGFRIEEGTSDELIPQLLLIVQSNAENSSNGRTNSEDAFDASARCPADCLDID
ncbi:MAG TPA: hypothetical protein VFU05_18360 [Cyclobacteriaceae bacterium]|nr:hypothetical protein [Cyclobacteriaceae bacterium]